MADPNLYAYVSGAALKSVDPVGLAVPCDQKCREQTGQDGGPIKDLYELWNKSASMSPVAKWATRVAVVGISVNYSPQLLASTAPALPEPMAGVVFAPRLATAAAAKAGRVGAIVKVARDKLGAIFGKKSIIAEVAKGRAWVVGKHGDMSQYGRRKTFAESHHGVMSRWMKAKYGDEYKPKQAPAVLMSVDAHNETRAEYNRWLGEMGDKYGDKFSWDKVSPTQARALANRLFDAAGTPQAVRNEYFKQFDAMIKSLDKATKKSK